MNIDVQTLALAGGIASLVEGIVLVVLYQQEKARSGPGWWLASSLAAGVAALLHVAGLDPRIDAAAAVLSLGTATGALVLAHIGILRFVGRRVPRGRLLATWAVLTAPLVVFALAGHAVVGYQALLGVAFSLFSALNVAVLLGPETRSFRSSAIFLASTRVFQGAFFAVRTAVVLFGAMTGASLSASSGWLVASSIVFIIAGVWTVFGYILMANQRLTGEIRESRDRIDQAHRAEMVARLAGGVAHNFNNLLTVIVVSAEFLARDVPPSDPRSEDVRNIREAALRGAAITEQLLSFGRRRYGLPNALDIDEVLLALSPMLREFAGDRIEVVLARGTGGARVVADRQQLDDVVVSLAVNACDAMTAGGRLTIETAAVTLAAGDARLRRQVRPGAYVSVTVADTGEGIAADVLPRIFEPFFSTKPAHLGSGLGLSSVEGMVGRLGGFVDVASELGRGSTFAVYLPRLVAQGD